MSFEVDGKLHKKFDTEQKTDSFRAREFVIEIQSGNYPQFIKFQLTQDRCDLLDAHQEGSMLKVYFDLRGREWNEKYFINLNAWRIDSKEDVPASPASDDPFPDASFPPFKGEGTPGASEMPTKDDLDDLPF